MKKLMMTIAAVALISVAAVAQQPEGRKPVMMSKTDRIEKRTEMMTERYELTKKQAKKVKKLNEQFADKIMLPKPEHGGKNGLRRLKASPEKMEAMKAAHQQYDAELQKILTADQFAKYKADIEQRGKMHMPKGNDGQLKKMPKGDKPHGMKPRQEKVMLHANDSVCCGKKDMKAPGCCGKKDGNAPGCCDKKQDEAEMSE